MALESTPKGTSKLISLRTILGGSKCNDYLAPSGRIIRMTNSSITTSSNSTPGEMSTYFEQRIPKVVFKTKVLESELSLKRYW